MYIHVPANIVREFSSRRVKVVAIVNADACDDKKLNGLTILFKAKLIEVGATFRLNIPAHYAPALAKLISCVTLDIVLDPLG
jgi:hypothetical protein